MTGDTFFQNLGFELRAPEWEGEEIPTRLRRNPVEVMFFFVVIRGWDGSCWQCSHVFTGYLLNATKLLARFLQQKQAFILGFRVLQWLMCNLSKQEKINPRIRVHGSFDRAVD